MPTAPEFLLVGILLALLGASVALLFIGGETAVWGARAVCVLLVMLLITGVWLPARRYLKETRDDSDTSEFPRT